MRAIQRQVAVGVDLELGIVEVVGDERVAGEEAADRPEGAVEVALERRVHVARVDHPVVGQPLLGGDLDPAEVPLARRELRSEHAVARVEESVVVEVRDVGVFEDAAERAVDAAQAERPRSGRPATRRRPGFPPSTGNSNWDRCRRRPFPGSRNRPRRRTPRSQGSATGSKLVVKPSRSPFNDRMFMSIGMSGTNWLYEAYAFVCPLFMKSQVNPTRGEKWSMSM